MSTFRNKAEDPVHLYPILIMRYNSTLSRYTSYMTKYSSFVNHGCNEYMTMH